MGHGRLSLPLSARGAQRVQTHTHTHIHTHSHPTATNPSPGVEWSGLRFCKRYWYCESPGPLTEKQILGPLHNFQVGLRHPGGSRDHGSWGNAGKRGIYSKAWSVANPPLWVLGAPASSNFSKMYSGPQGEMSSGHQIPHFLWLEVCPLSASQAQVPHTCP